MRVLLLHHLILSTLSSVVAEAEDQIMVVAAVLVV